MGMTERSTYLGLISLVGACGVHIAPAAADWIATGGVALAGAILVLTKDHSVREAIHIACQDVADATKPDQPA